MAKEGEKEVTQLRKAKKRWLFRCQKKDQTKIKYRGVLQLDGHEAGKKRRENQRVKEKGCQLTKKMFLTLNV